MANKKNKRQKKAKFCSWNDLKHDQKQKDIYKESARFIAEKLLKYANGKK